MPYAKNSDLPSPVKDHLPSHAQDIFREAFNHAWIHYEISRKRTGGSSQEDTAFRVAWAAVKKRYHKVNNAWVEKE
jgi:cation transport regulator